VKSLGVAVIGAGRWGRNVASDAEPLREAVREFVAAIREERTPLTGAAAELRVLSIIEAASESLQRAGQAVPLEAYRSR